MNVVTRKIKISSKGHTDLFDITGEITRELKASGLKSGTANVFVPGSTAGVTTLEYEPGLVKDIKVFFDRLLPEEAAYHHNDTWGDGNGYAHVRSALLKTSLTVPFDQGKLLLGTWQQVVFVDFDNRPRTREIVIQFSGI